MSTHPIELTWNEALSGIFGAISLAAWIFLLVGSIDRDFDVKLTADRFRS
jgi:hypothetical protein